MPGDARELQPDPNGMAQHGVGLGVCPKRSTVPVTQPLTWPAHLVACRKPQRRSAMFGSSPDADDLPICEFVIEPIVAWSAIPIGNWAEVTALREEITPKNVTPNR